MPDDARDDHRKHAGLLTRLRRDRRGNVLAMSAAMIVPLAGLVGGGLDISRMYIAKTRLQHACDAGALAGRKAMGAGNWNQSDYAPRTMAEQFFDGNWRSGGYGSDTLARQFTEHAGKVAGTASVQMPTTLMRIFGAPTVTLAVACDAEMRLPNTDVMFVLDTTGSMSQNQPGDNVSKIAALRTAVKCFYEIVARLDTNAQCTTGTPSGGTGDQVQIRFGFVPYASNVNVGRLLPTGWFADSWQYQTRRAMTHIDTSERWAVRSGYPQTQTTNEHRQVPQNYCNQQAAKSLDTDDTTYNGDRTVRTNVKTTHHVDSYSNGNCYGRVERTTTISDRLPAQEVFDEWSYWRHPVTVSGLKNGAAWNAAVNLPIGPQGAMVSVPWDGCIEERKTIRTKDYSSTQSGSRDDKAWDLDIDFVPVKSEAYSLWGPALPNVVFTPRGAAADWTRDEVRSTADYPGVDHYCPSESKLLQKWPDTQIAGQPKFEDYVDSLVPSGATYHDIGLLWGARFLSPTGLFAATNARTPQGGDIERHLIFMTDGDPCTYRDIYAAYGLAWFDRRQTDEQTAPTFGCTQQGTITEQVNLRTAALCTAIKNKSITLWVVAFGSLANSTKTRLNACATPGRYFEATNAATLQQTFKAIADQISMLRLTS